MKEDFESFATKWLLPFIAIVMIVFFLVVVFFME